MSKLEGTVESIVFRNDTNGWTIASVRVDGSRGALSCKGIMPFLTVGEHAIFDGELGNHPDYGQQLTVRSYELVQPETASAVEAYLASGLIRGIGPATAKAIVARFGPRALEVMESEPGRLTEVPGIGRKKAADILESFAAVNAQRGVVMFLQQQGISPAMAMRIIKTFGVGTERLVRDNPYRLADEIQGIGFQTADAIAMRLGFARESEFRLRSGLLFTLNEAASGGGHMYLPKDELIQRAAALLGVEEALAERRLRELLLSGELVSEAIGNEAAVYLPRLHTAECEVARLLTKLIRDPRRRAPTEEAVLAKVAAFEAEGGVTLCQGQREAVLTAARAGVCVITGGPGTGKTTSINIIIKLLREQGKVDLCAPTGRAAKRMNAATGCPASTIHRLLEYNPETGGFLRDEDVPLDADAVIVDEMSMVDIFLMRALLSALRPGAQLILVGDADQLPSIGAGNVLRDLIGAGTLPVARLTEIFRQAGESQIVLNAHRINRGEYPVIRTRDTDFFLERRQHPAEVAAAVVALVKARLPKYMGLDSLRDIQVMAPMKKSDIGVIQLNAMLQAALNPERPGRPCLRRGAAILRPGDKVMQVRNNYDLQWHRDGEDGAGVFNGDIGFITAVRPQERSLTIEFDDGRVADYDDAQLEDVELAYCMSVHKSQGSEFDAVVLPLLGGPPLLMTRNLLYTAVTRARRLVVVVGREGCIREMVDNNPILKRYSALDLRLRTL